MYFAYQCTKGAYQGTGQFAYETGILVGGHGDGKKRQIFKPTGLLDSPRRGKQAPIIEDRLEEAHEFAVDALAVHKDDVPILASRSTLSNIDQEIGVLMRKKLLNDEDEAMLIVLIAATL